MKNRQSIINQIRAELSIESESLDDFTDKHLLIYSGPGDPQPNDETKLSSKLIEAMKKDQVSGHSCGRTLAYYDPQANEICYGIKYRTNEQQTITF